MAGVSAVGSKGKEMQRAVILGRQIGVNQKGFKYQGMEIEFCSTATPTSEQGEVRVARCTEGRKGSYQTSQCKCSAVHLMLPLSQVHLTPWLFSRCQKTRGIFNIMQTISIIMQTGDVCAQWWSLSQSLKTLKKQEEKSIRLEFCYPLKHDFPT